MFAGSILTFALFSYRKRAKQLSPVLKFGGGPLVRLPKSLFVAQWVTSHSKYFSLIPDNLPAPIATSPNPGSYYRARRSTNLMTPTPDYSPDPTLTPQQHRIISLLTQGQSSPKPPPPKTSTATP